MIKIRNRAHTKYRSTKLHTDLEQYKILRKHVARAIRVEQRIYFDRVINEGKSNEMWKIMRGLGVVKEKSSVLPNHLSCADDINKHFVTAGDGSGTADQELIDYYMSNNRLVGDERFAFEVVSEEVVASLLLNIKSKSVGADGITLQMLCYCCPYALPYITHIINFCIQESTFPSCWKTAIVIPLPKTPNPSTYNDLRPISILPVLSKVLEKILAFQIREFINRNNIVPSTQSGFRRGHSCATALLHVTDDIFRATDKRKLTVLIMFDYSKAFDTVNHRVLDAVLSFSGFGSDSRRLVANYMCGREQKLKINDRVSSAERLLAGVAQGSILGPLMFSIYTSNFTNSFKFCQSHFYADDSQLYYSFEPKDSVVAQQNINTDICNLLKVSEKHNLKLNPTKTTVMLFGPRVARVNLERFELRVGGTSLIFLESHRNLGLLIDTDLRFTGHIADKTRKAYAALKLIYSIRDTIGTATRIKLCDSLALSHFNFCDIVYNRCLDRVTENRVQRVQNSCIRLVFGLRRRDHVSSSIVRAGWLNMANRRRYHTLSFFHKLLALKTPAYLYNKITFRSDVHNVNIRSRGCISPPQHFTAIFERSFTFTLPQYYNPLQHCMKELTLSLFKRTLRQLLFSEQAGISQ